MNKIAYNLFFDKFYINLAVIIQIAICISFINVAVGITNAFYVGYKDSYYFNDAEYFMSTTGNISFRYNKENIESTGSIIEFNYPTITTLEYNIVSYKQKTLEKYTKNYLIKGEYKPSQNGIVNCLVVGDKSMK